MQSTLDQEIYSKAYGTSYLDATTDNGYDAQHTKIHGYDTQHPKIHGYDTQHPKIHGYEKQHPKIHGYETPNFNSFDTIQHPKLKGTPSTRKAHAVEVACEEKEVRKKY